MEAEVKSVRKVADAWVEIDAKSGHDGEYPVDPIRLRPGVAEDTVRVSEGIGSGSEIKITDLREGLDLIEQEQRR